MGHEGHDHHAHGHAHEHAAHGHASDRHRTDEIPRGVGTGKILFLDAPSGLAGDMLVSALVDLGVPPAVVADAIAAVPVAGFHVHFGTRVRSGIVAASFEVHVDEAQPARTYGAIRALLEESTLAESIKGRARRTFRRLAQAESKVHRMPIDDVHFHEVGAIDAIADIVGSAAALDYVGAEDIVVSPLPMGRGYVKAAHGLLPLPAPATVECLTGFATYDAGLDFEFVTPTGAAIVGAQSQRIAAVAQHAARARRMGRGHGRPGRPTQRRARRARRASQDGPTTPTTPRTPADPRCA